MYGTRALRLYRRYPIVISGKHTRYDQKIDTRYWMVDPKSRTSYCFNHKVASTTWMAVFAKLQGDEEFLKQAEEDGMYYP